MLELFTSLFLWISDGCSSVPHRQEALDSDGLMRFFWAGRELPQELELEMMWLMGFCNLVYVFVCIQFF